MRARFTMRRALGKGLSQLLGEEEEHSSSEVAVTAISTNPRQPRKAFAEDAMAELCASVKEHGIVQPLVVRPIGDNRYELIAGERRLRAAKMAGLKRVPVVVRTASSQVSLELALIENVQREDINPIECAMAYKLLADEFGLTQDQVANKVGKSRVGVSNTLRLLRLPEDIQESIASGVITEGHAKALLMVDSPTRLRALFEKTVAEGLSVREVERMARGEARSPHAGPDQSIQEPDADWDALARRISEHFGAKIRLDRKKSGGRLSIDYFSEDELEGILEKMGIRL